MRGGLRRFPVAIAACFVLSLVGAAPARDALSGMARDTLGNVLAGVEVLLVDPDLSSVPAAVARTDGAGRFAVAALRPGIYQVAAVKSGYDTFVGRVDTLLSNTYDVVLRPWASVDGNALPGDASWALRLPRRGVLRDVDPAAIGEQEPATGDALEFQFDQLLSTGADTSGRGPEPLEVEASETRLGAIARIGGQTELRVRARHERQGTSSSDADHAQAAQAGRAVEVGVGQDIGFGSRLEIAARLVASEQRLAAPDVGQYGQEQRSAGYDVAWVDELAHGPRVGIALAGHETALEGPGEDLIARRMSVQGSYRHARTDGHDIELVVRAEAWPDAWSPGVTGTSASTVGLGLSAGDRFDWGGPLWLTYGLTVDALGRTGQAGEQALTPRIGAGSTVGGVRFEGAVSWLAGSDGGGPDALLRAADRLGYEVGMQVPVVEQVRVEGSSRHEPRAGEVAGYAPGADPAVAQPIYVSDGNLSRTEHRLALIEQRGSTHVAVELVDGRVRGGVVPVMRYADPRELAGSDLGYRGACLGIRAPSLGTDVAVEYRRLEARAATEGGRSIEESVDVRVGKHLSTSRRLGDWRVLLAIHVASIETAALREWKEHGGAESIQAMNRRLSGGVSVHF